MTEKKEKLKLALLDAAENRIVEGGVFNLKARDVTKDAGCALGSLYNAYEDLDVLILHVNARTLQRLYVALSEAKRDAKDPWGELRAMAAGYCDFVSRNWNAWSALFDYQFAADRQTPDWLTTGQAVLIAEVVRPLSEITGETGEAAERHARILFSAVHGIVKLSMEQRFAALDPIDLQAQLDDFLVRYLSRY